MGNVGRYKKNAHFFLVYSSHGAIREYDYRPTVVERARWLWKKRKGWRYVSKKKKREWIKRQSVR